MGAALSRIFGFLPVILEWRAASKAGDDDGKMAIVGDGARDNVSAIGRLRGAESVQRNQRDGAAWPRSLQMDWGCGPMPPRACQLSASAPALTSGASRMSADRPKAIPEPSNPPSAPASPFERRFTAPPPQRPVRGRQRTRGIPISPRGPTCSQPHMSRGTSSCPLCAW